MDKAEELATQLAYQFVEHCDNAMYSRIYKEDYITRELTEAMGQYASEESREEWNKGYEAGREDLDELTQRADLSGYSRGVAETEGQLSEERKKLLADIQNQKFFHALPPTAKDDFYEWAENKEQ